jgi:hypothetical protein
MSADGELNVDACHSCLQSGQVGNVTVGKIYDATKEIKLMIEESSMDDVAKPVALIARRIFDEIKAKYHGKQSIIFFLRILQKNYYKMLMNSFFNFW